MIKVARAYVANRFSHTVSVINTLSNRVIAAIPVGKEPFGLAASPNGRRVYVANRNSSTVSVISTQLNRVVATIPVRSDVETIAITPNRRQIYVAGSRIVSIISTRSNRVINRIRFRRNSEGEKGGVAVTPNGRRVYMTNTFSDTVLVMSTQSNRVIATIPVGMNPIGIVIIPTRLSPSLVKKHKNSTRSPKSSVKRKD